MKVLKIILSTLFILFIYYILWTPSTYNISEKATTALLESERTSRPNNDFSNCINLPKKDRKDYTGTPGKYPQTCMNTVSYFYSPKANWAQCNYFVNNIKKLGFKETKNPKPGDIVIFFKKNNDARHTGLYVGKSLFGPLMNHSDGGKKPYNYQKHLPIKLFMLVKKDYIYYKYYTYIQ